MLLNMFENEKSNLQIKFNYQMKLFAYYFKYFQNNNIRKSWDCTKTPNHPTLKANSTLRIGGRCDYYFAKIKRKDEPLLYIHFSVTCLCFSWYYTHCLRLVSIFVIITNMLSMKAISNGTRFYLCIICFSRVLVTCLIILQYFCVLYFILT